ncbi:MAG: flagellar export chaperone FlgN [Pseudomonadota bacterium]
MTNPVNEIHHILKQKLEACNDFLSATNLLEEALEKEEMTTVDRLIGRREELMRVIESIDRRLGRYQREYPFDRTPPAAKVSEDINRVLKQIISVNQECNAVAAGRYESLKEDLMIIRQKEAGFHGYSRATRMRKFLDIRT